MSNTELKQKLKQLRNEELVWLIYIGIIIMSWYANNLERKYFIYNDQNSKEKYLYNEFSIVLGLTYEETKDYVVKKVTELIKNNS